MGWTINGMLPRSDKMAAVSEGISDRDLRAKLKEHGISAGPITPTTKKLYINKLNKKLTGVESGSKSAVKKPSKKSLSPRRSPGRSPARDYRNAAGPTSHSKRKLVGFSSDEEEPSEASMIPKPTRLPGRASPATHSAARDEEERPSALLRFRKPVNTPTYKMSEDEERSVIDGMASIPRDYNEFKLNAAKHSPYTSLRQLFMIKSMDDSQKSSERTPPRQPPPETRYDVEDEDESERKNVRSYVWVLFLLCAVTLIVFYNWQFIVTVLWKPRVNPESKFAIRFLS